MTTNAPPPRRIHGAALRTPQRHIAERHAIDGEDLAAADALVMAIEVAEQALDRSRVARRGTSHQ